MNQPSKFCTTGTRCALGAIADRTGRVMSGTRTMAPRGHHLVGRRWIKNAEEAGTVSFEPFSPPSVEVIVARKRNTTWHVVACHAIRTRSDRSAVSLADETRLASAPSGTKAAQAVLDVARQPHAMAVIPPLDDSHFAAACPTHGVVRRNGTIDYAIESAYEHALTEHDATPESDRP